MCLPTEVDVFLQERYRRPRGRGEHPWYQVQTGSLGEDIFGGPCLIPLVLRVGRRVYCFSNRHRRSYLLTLTSLDKSEIGKNFWISLCSFVGSIFVLLPVTSRRVPSKVEGVID